MKTSDLRDRLSRGVLIFDGGFGTELYRRNFFVNTSYEELCLTAPATVAAIHQSYVEAGAEVLTTNTYNANAAALGQFGIADRTAAVNQAAVSIARKAAAGKPGILVAGSVGPAADAKTAAAIAEQASVLAQSGADLLIFESLSSAAELRNALAALPEKEGAYIVSFTFDAEAKLADRTGFTEIADALAAAPYPPAAFGLNCGTGPETTLAALEKIAGKTTLPLVVQPGAGVPKSVDRRFMNMTSPEYFTT